MRCRPTRPTLLCAWLALALHAPAAMAIDLGALWDFRDPARSEQRFRDALAGARGDDALVLQTQIARSLGLRRDFDGARALLAVIGPAVAGAGPEARARHALELGRSFASATHPADAVTAASKAQARAHYQQALAIAREARLDGLAVDAIHMLAFVDTAPADQLKWADAALAVVLASDQPAAQRWQASIRNNRGVALHQLGRLDEALAEFERALALREQGSDPAAQRVARWMVAWTLRGLGRADQALALQLQLAREGDAAQQPDPYVFEELETLYRDRGDLDRAAEFAARRAALPK